MKGLPGQDYRLSASCLMVRGAKVGMAGCIRSWACHSRQRIADILCM